MEALEKEIDTQAIVRRAVDYLHQKIRVDQVVLFGSHARAEADEWSDIDLAVVSADFERMSQQEIMNLLVEVALAVDPSLEVRPYSPKDLTEARPTNFLGHILAQGRRVYKNGEFVESPGRV